ncbi:MAG TPA: PHB depolymerase family esterase [Polyangia bacterium]|nr:PHB depolymerase family esterase [Polyangia bacterium]
MRSSKLLLMSLVWTVVACGSSTGTSGARSGGTGGGASATGGSVGSGGAAASTGGSASGGTPGSVGSGGVNNSGGSAGGGVAEIGSGGVGGSSPPTRSAGCGVTSSPTGTKQDMMLNVSGQSTVRTYRLSVPATYDPNSPLPLLFGFHGVGGTGAQTQTSFNLESSTAGGGKAIFVYPDALPKQEPNDGGVAVDWVTPLGASNKGIDFAFFEALVSEIESKYCIDTSRVFATGISAGGIFTNFVGCWYGDILRAIAPVASEKPWSTPHNSPSNMLCNGDVAAMVIHGTNDPYSSYTTNGLGTLDFWLAQNGCQTTDPTTDAVTPNACQDYQGCAAGLPVVMCSHDEGHAWPVKTGFSCSSTSTVCFDANIAVWDFFTSLP